MGKISNSFNLVPASWNSSLLLNKEVLEATQLPEDVDFTSASECQYWAEAAEAAYYAQFELMDGVYENI